MKRLLLVVLGVLMVNTLVAQPLTDDFKREGTKADRVSKNKLEGVLAPALHASKWMNVEDEELTLKNLKGKVVVIDFWGVWCPPCRAAIPHLKKLYEKHKEDGLVIIGIHTTSQGDRMEQFVKDKGITWPVAIDLDKQTVKAFAVDSYPDYYLIDRKGILRVADLANADLDRAVEILLEEK